MVKSLRVIVSLIIALPVVSCMRPRQPPIPTDKPAADLSRQISGRDLRRDPLTVQDMSLQVIDDSSGLLRVGFAEQKPLPRTLSVVLDGSVVALRDDGGSGDDRAGDRRFTATVPFDRGEIERRQDKLVLLAGKPIPTFRGRVKLPDVTLRPPKTIRFHPDEIIDLLPPQATAGNPANISADRSLMIVDPQVTQDPTRTRTDCAVGSTGKWSFGYLMEQLANQPLTGVSPSQFALRWLQRWEFTQVANDWTVDSRSQIRPLIIDPWITASGGPGSPLDLSKAPFRLLAIVNRVDLRENVVYGGGSAGEARFVFGAVGPAPSCDPLPFTVIFEYGIHDKNCIQLKAWAQQWKDLDTHTIGTPAYNAALEAITEQFVVANAAPSRPNGSALNQLRTNEIALAGPWELREFQITSASAGHLDLVTVKQTPDISLNNTVVLADYVNANEADVVLAKHQVPLQFPIGSPFLGASSPVSSAWDKKIPPGPTITNREARFQFSLNTCSGCHAPETSTSFTHVFPAEFGPVAADLSGFLTGIFNVSDPADGLPERDFNDLERRAADLDELLSKPCFSFISFKPLNMVH